MPSKETKTAATKNRRKNVESTTIDDNVESVSSKQSVKRKITANNKYSKSSKIKKDLNHNEVTDDENEQIIDDNLENGMLNIVY